MIDTTTLSHKIQLLLARDTKNGDIWVFFFFGLLSDLFFGISHVCKQTCVGRWHKPDITKKIKMDLFFGPNNNSNIGHSN